MYASAMTAFAGAPEMDHLRISLPVGLLTLYPNGKSVEKRTVDALYGMAVNRHYRTSREVQDATEYCPDNEKPTSANSINKGQYGASCNQKDDILDNGRC